MPEGTLLRHDQIRRLAFLVLLFLVSLSLLFLYPQMRAARDRALHEAASPEAPAAGQAPSPPPSPFAPGAVILHGALKAVEDLKPLEALDVDPAYQKLVEHVSMLGDRALRQASEGEITYSTYLQYAPELRGRTFRASGVAVKVEAVRLPHPIQGREDVYRVYLLDPGRDGGGYIFDLVDRPGPIDPKQDRVEIDGTFLKVIRYANKRDQTRDAPLLIGRTLRPLVSTPSGADDRLSVLKLVLAVGIGLALVSAYFILGRMARRPGLRGQVERPPRRMG